jgi:EAL domain-containing protein (putative c-di-GMP-specific phosphodiesterase class I)
MPRPVGLLAATGLDPALLTLEITESSIIGDFATALTALQQLRDLGVHLSLDDFGVGYSSLTYLHRLPVDEVKIDKSFVMPMAHSPAAQAITRSVVGLGHSLGLTVVAEGIETTSPRAPRCCTMGCDTMQGYLLSRPLSGDQLTCWLADPEGHRLTRRRSARAARSG